MASLNPVAIIRIPGRPLPKGRPRHTKNGGTYTPPKTREFEKMVSLLAMTCRTRFGPERVSVEMEFHTKSRADIDNLAKAILDAIQGVIFDDDRQVDQLLLTRQEPLDEEWSLIRVSALKI